MANNKTDKYNGNKNNVSKNDGGNNYSVKALILIFILALILGILFGALVFRNGGSDISKTDMELTYNTLMNEYIDKIDKDKINEAAINGMIKYINDEFDDQHTNYINKQDSKDFSETMTGTFYGTGCAIYKYKDEPVTISRVFKDSPAFKAGLKAGDQFIKINGEDVSKEDTDGIIKLIKGKDKKKFELVVKRGKKEKTTTVITDIVNIPSVESKILEKDGKKIGYIYISIFAANTDEQFKEELSKLEKDGISRYIIDVRYDSGGDLDTVINIASNFMNKDSVVVKIVDKKKVTDLHSVGDESKDYKLAVLVNKASASGSEVLASALHDNSGAVIIGETTYGKGSVQHTKSLSTGAMIKYTVETWETSKGKQINKKGIKPDIYEKLNKKYFKTYKEKDDNQLQKALEELAH